MQVSRRHAGVIGERGLPHQNEAPVVWAPEASWQICSQQALIFFVAFQSLIY